MAALFTNNASSTLLSSITAAATTLFVQVADGVLFPTPVAASDYFMLTLEDRTQNPVAREIVKCTARTGNQMTVVRAQEGTTALNWAANVTVSNRITAAILSNLTAGTSMVNQLYLGSYASAPTQTLEHTVLIPGNLYYDTVLVGLYQYNGVAWKPIAAAASTSALGIYLGQFTVPPISMLDGTALVQGTLYYSTSIPGLQIYNGGAWGATTSTAVTPPGSNANVVNGNLSVTGNVTAAGNGHFTNVIADLDVSASTIHMGGKLLVSSGDVSGTTGIQNFPSGVSLRMGTATVSAALPGIFYDTPFPTQTLGVLITCKNDGLNGYGVEGTGLWTATGFSAVLANATSGTHVTATFSYMAWGD